MFVIIVRFSLIYVLQGECKDAFMVWWDI